MQTCDMTHQYVWHDSFICVTWLIQAIRPLLHWFICAKWLMPMCDMAHSYMWRDLFRKYDHYSTHSFVRCDWCTCVTWLIHMCDTTHSGNTTTTALFICAKSPILMCDMTHVYVWHDSFLDVTWLIQAIRPLQHSFIYAKWLILMCDMTDSYVWHDLFIYMTWLILAIRPLRHSFICATWLIHTCDMTHSDSTTTTALIHLCKVTDSHVWHDSFIYVTWLIHICAMTHSDYTTTTALIYLCKMTDSHVWHDSFICLTRLIQICDTWLIQTIRPLQHSFIGVTWLILCVWHDSFRQYDHYSIHSFVWYGVATISRLLKIKGLFCKRALYKRRYSAKVTYNFKEPTISSHPIWVTWLIHICVTRLAIQNIVSFVGLFCKRDL